MDFFQIAVQERKKGEGFEAKPDFIVGRSEDLMVRAKNFYAIWDERENLWSTDEYKVQVIVDEELKAYAAQNKQITNVKYMRSFGTNGQSTFRKFMREIGDNAHQLDEKLTFADTPVTKKDYVSKRLPYKIGLGDHSAWDEMVGTLYLPTEREKIEWFLGCIVSGDSIRLQKFMVLYGPPGAGKGTILDIIHWLFDGYITTFDAKALGSSANQFAAAAFASNPLVAIQHDGDLSRIEDNTTLNSIVSHEIMRMNEKHKPAYDSRVNAVLIMGTNKPVKITDAQSGLIRRLIDVHPSGTRIPPQRYHVLKDRIKFELGAIAHHCLRVYTELGKNYFSNYQPLEMMFKTNAFFNFIEFHYDVFAKQDGTSVKQAWAMYKEWCPHANIDRPMSQYAFKNELGSYFEEFHERITLDGVTVRSYYKGFKAEPFKTSADDEPNKFVLRMDETISLLNLELAEYPAQYAKADGNPSKYWTDDERMIKGEMQRPKPHQVVDTLLRDLDPTREHYVKVPDNMVVIDFDLKDENGEKSLGRNLEAAALWPATYAELSRSGDGVHLHYYFDGDTEQLDPHYADGIEVKLYHGNSALRRKLTRCNAVAIAVITSGLPLKEKKRVLDPGTLKSEKGLRDLIARNLRKEIHPGTKPSIDFIAHILDEAYRDGLQYDVSDLRQRVMVFANNSSNKALECLKIVQGMRWKSDDATVEEAPAPTEDRLVFFDIEVYPNLFVVCWKFEEELPSKDSVTRMINPKSHEVEALLRFKLVGFNNRQYDNHILWGAALGYNNQQLYNLSKKIIAGGMGTKFGEAYRISHTDIYDYSATKQGLKKWQIAQGLEHREMDIPWDQPVPEDRILDVVEYCANDVVSSELVHKHLKGDWSARLLLADLANLTPNDTTAKLTSTIVFGKARNPQADFVYTDLRKEFPGYEFKLGKSTYRGEDVGEGGYVYAEPGLYRDVALLDVASMHPTSIGVLELFGPHTPKYMALVDAQLALKRGDLETAKGLLEGKLRPYIAEIETLAETDPEAAKKAAGSLRYGLKIAMNIVYGLTSAKFDNAFRDVRNVDNIVAKRGALFMIDLVRFIQEQGFQVAHVKTDSVKIVGATQEIIEAVQNFSAKYGYNMEHDPDKDRYSKLGLLNDAVYVAKLDHCNTNCWTATGAQFQVPFVFKSLFGNGDFDFNDVCETKHVQQGALYLDFGTDISGEMAENIGRPSGGHIGWMDYATAMIKWMKKNGQSEEDQQRLYADCIDQLVFVGKTGRFTPVKSISEGGGQLWRVKDGKAYAVQGTKGYLWMDSNLAMTRPDEAIDYRYFGRMVGEAWFDLGAFIGGSEFASVEDFLA